MTKEEFVNLMNSGTEIVLLDIRESEELLQEETILGSANMPMGKVFTSVADGTLSKDKTIIVFCRSGKRASIVERELSALGFTIQALEGGLQKLRSNN